MIVLKARQQLNFTVEESYKKFANDMAELDGPLGFKDVDIGTVPTFGASPIAGMKIKYPNKSIKFVGGYSLRGGLNALAEKSRDDDFIWIGFSVPNKNISYDELIHVSLPEIIRYFGAYRTTLDLNEFYAAYCGGYIYTDDGVNGFDAGGNPVDNNEEFKTLSRNSDIDIDGRNNIFGLRPVQYWDRELCHAALNFGPEEVAIRLNGKVPKVELMERGVYVILNEDPYMNFDDFLKMNEANKKILGLL